jgi:hypothetical protein
MRRGLAALILLTAVTFGFAHRAIVPTPPDLSAYALPDGSLPVLCQTDGQKSGQPAHGGDCPACRLTHDSLPPPHDDAARVAYPVEQTWPPVPRMVVAADTPSGWQARAPPGF